MLPGRTQRTKCHRSIVHLAVLLLWAESRRQCCRRQRYPGGRMTPCRHLERSSWGSHRPSGHQSIRRLLLGVGRKSSRRMVLSGGRSRRTVRVNHNPSYLPDHRAWLFRESACRMRKYHQPGLHGRCQRRVWHQTRAQTRSDTFQLLCTVKRRIEVACMAGHIQCRTGMAHGDNHDSPRRFSHLSTLTVRTVRLRP